MLTDCLHLILIAKSDTIFQRNHVSLIAAENFQMTVASASIDSTLGKSGSAGSFE